MYDPKPQKFRFNSNYDSQAIIRRYGDSHTRQFIKEKFRGITTYIALDNDRRSTHK